MAIEIVDVPIKNGDFPIKNGDFPIKNSGSFQFAMLVITRPGMSQRCFLQISQLPPSAPAPWGAAECWAECWIFGIRSGIKRWIHQPLNEPLKIAWLIDCYRGLYYLVYWGLRYIGVSENVG